MKTTSMKYLTITLFAAITFCEMKNLSAVEDYELEYANYTERMQAEAAAEDPMLYKSLKEQDDIPAQSDSPERPLDVGSRQPIERPPQFNRTQDHRRRHLLVRCLGGIAVVGSAAFVVYSLRDALQKQFQHCKKIIMD